MELNMLFVRAIRARWMIKYKEKLYKKSRVPMMQELLEEERANLKEIEGEIEKYRGIPFSPRQVIKTYRSLWTKTGKQKPIRAMMPKGGKA
jgi:hypothetical protein